VTFHSADADFSLDAVQVATQAGVGLATLISRVGEWGITKALPGFPGLRVTHLPSGRALPSAESATDSPTERERLLGLAIKLAANVPAFVLPELPKHRATIERVRNAWLEESRANH
jgi:hypothetical protein